MRSYGKKILPLFILLIICIPGYSQEIIDSLLKISDTASVELKAYLYNKISSEYMPFDIKLSREYAGKALELSIRNKNRNQEAQALLIIGSIEKDEGNFEKALVYFTRSLPIYKELNDHGGIAHVYNLSGHVRQSQGIYDKALELYLKALRIYDKLITIDNSNENKERKGYTLNLIGSVYMYMNNYESALESFKRSLAIREDAGHNDDIANSLSNIGLYYHYRMEYDTALYYYKRSLQIKEENNTDKVSIGAILNNIGLVYSKKGDHKKAVHYYRKALEVLPVYGPRYSVARIYINMGYAYYNQNQYEQAEQYYKKAMEIAEESGARDQISDIYECLSETEESGNNYAKALEYYRIFREIKDSIFNTETNEKIAEMQTRYETENREKEIIILQKDKLLREAELTRRRNWLIVFITGFIILSGLLVLLFIQKIQKNRLYRELVYKNLQIIGSDRNMADKSVTDREQPPSGISHDAGEQKTNKYSTAPLSEQQKRDILKRIVDLVEKEKLYLDSDMSVEICAKKLDISRYYISQVINDKLGQNFKNFINSYRIKKAQMIMADKDSEKFTIEAISSQAGFKTRNSFTLAFKKYTGVTPSFYLKTVHNKKTAHHTE